MKKAVAVLFVCLALAVPLSAQSITIAALDSAIAKLQAALAELIGERDRLIATLPVETCAADGFGNGVDEDGDGQVDEGCLVPPPTPVEVCNADGTGNGIDDDGDGLVDETCLPSPPPPPPPDSETNVWKVVTPSYIGAPLGGKLVPQLWQTGNGVDIGDQVLWNDRWYDTTRGINIYANGLFGFNPVTNVVEVLKLNNWRNNPCTQARIDAGECSQVGGYTTDPMPEFQTDPTPVDSHPLAGLLFDPVSRSVLDINGANSSAFKYYPDGDMFETWRLSLSTRTWTKVADGAAGDPHPPKDIDDYVCAVYDPQAQKGVYFDVTNVGTETWLFDFSTNRWSKLPMDASAVGIAVAAAGCTYDTTRNRILVLGGARTLYNLTDAGRQKLRAYSVATNTWTELAAPPVIPVAPEFAYAPPHDGAVALIRRRLDDGKTVFDTYFYNASADAWVKIAEGFYRGPLSIPGHAGTLTYHATSGLFVSQGGVWNAPVFATLKLAFVAPAPDPDPEPDPTPVPDPDPDPVPPPPSEDPVVPSPGVGKGCTSIYFIDVDCDGYGVAVRSGGDYSGPGLGDKPDADDTNPWLNTAASVVAAYDADHDGTLSAAELKTFLLVRRGITAARILYLDPAGDNATAVIDNPSRPFRTFYAPVSGTTALGANKYAQPGDAIVFRGGTYKDRLGSCCPYMPSGTATAPVTVMAMPGERVVLADTLVSAYKTQHLRIVGFALENTLSPGFGNGLVLSEAQHLTVQDLEIQRYNFPTGMQDLREVLIERYVSHDNKEHGLYLGSRDLPNANVTLRDSIIYRNGVAARYGAFQMNGRTTNLRVEGNILHGNGQWGISFAQGVSDSLVQNNLIFNNAGNAIILQLYATKPEDVQACLDGTLLICPYAQTGNRIVNNTIWVGRFDLSGNGSDTSLRTAILVGRNDLPADPKYSQGNNTVQNNIFVTESGPVIRDLNAENINTWTIRNNVIYRRQGDSGTIFFGSTAYALSGFQAAFPLATGNLFADPQVLSADVTFWSTPDQFNFRLGEGSPAIGFGLLDGAPTTDLQGRPRVAPIDAGAYAK